MKLIYAADDEKNIRGLLKSFLENEGYAVEVFETGDLLFEKFLKAPADLVILDIMMPDRKSTRLNSSHIEEYRMPSSA